ncbi:MAG: hypothetical protein R2861_16655 [Desulfobacterales bacterium]
MTRIFASGTEEVTEACLSCYTEAVEQFHETIHGTGRRPMMTGTRRKGWLFRQ